MTEGHVLCCVASLQSCPTLYDPMDHSPPGSSVHGVSQARMLEQVAMPQARVLEQVTMPQARVLEWVAMPSFRGPSQPRDQTCISNVSCTGRRVLYH